MSDTRFTPGLVERLSDFNQRLASIGEKSASGELSPVGTSNAIALLTTLNAGLFRDAESALAQARGESA